MCFSPLRKLLGNPMINAAVRLTGNERACLWLEPLWGIPYNLYIPFVSVYMAALGLSPVQIGTVQAVFFGSQMVFALLSGVLTDKLGRRLCTLIFDVLSWSVPALLWMLAQNYVWFIAAALLNGAWRVTENSWGLLLIEEAPPGSLITLYSLAHIAGLVAGFLAPLAYIFVQEYSVVPTMRVLYAFTFVMMTLKFILLYFMTHETRVGVRKKAECKSVSMLSHLLDSRYVLMRMLKDRRVMLTIAIVACYATIRSVHDSFWPLLVTDKLGITAENLSIFSTVKTLLMLLFYFVVVPKINVARFLRPLVMSFLLLCAVETLMLMLPPNAYVPVVLSVALEALALSMLSPLTSSLQALALEESERARMMGLFYALCMLLTSPMSALAGVLSQMNRALPMAMNLGFALAASALSLRLGRLNKTEGTAI